ncbi:hypothetical protein, partial [Vibrio aestuarianus]|uniref:hypothetical protein n=2 Tax=Vibrio TaxID=662 RepID=UPI003144FD97
KYIMPNEYGHISCKWNDVVMFGGDELFPYGCLVVSDVDELPLIGQEQALRVRKSAQPNKEGVYVVDDVEIVENHLGKMVYNKSDLTSKVVDCLGSIDSNYTISKPSSMYDEWVNESWVTNQSNKHIAEYNQVDIARRAAYREVSDPLYMEALRKESRGLTDEAAEYRTQADAAVELIKLNLPWPEPLTN